MTRWLCSMGPHRLVVPAPTLTEAAAELERRLASMGLELNSTVSFDPQPEA